MKAIDTNVLVRFLVNDDRVQAERARRLFEATERAGGRLLIPLAVVLETIWVLEASYDCPRTAIFEMLEKLTRVPALEFEAGERVKLLADLGPASALDPADLLIALSARELGCEATFTFDRKAARSDLFELLQQA